MLNDVDYPIAGNAQDARFTWEPELTTSPADDYAPRSGLFPLLFLLPVVLCGLSWLIGGVPFLTDMGFVALAALSLIGLAAEFVRFPQRFGVGGLLIFGGVLIWFCYDYFTNWFGRRFGSGGVNFTPAVVAKAAFYHSVFVVLMLGGLMLPPWRRLVRLFHVVPEPSSSNFYLVLVAICFLVGMLPYTLFTAEGAVGAIYAEITGGRAGGATWLAGRTGSVNYSWGGYLSVLMHIGQVGAQLAVFYAILLARSPISKLICWMIWGLHLALAFGGGTRGEIAFMGLPVLVLLFLKYQSEAAAAFRRLSVKAYAAAGLVLLCIIVIVQIQATFRASGYRGADFKDVNVLQLKGNSMFSEGLPGWALIPERQGFFGNRVPGEGLVRALPETVWRFLIGPIPRALWHSKPIDPMWAWYNAAVTGRDESELEGTTISTGLVGGWYFRYGFAGVVQGALLFGWLCRVGERALQTSAGRATSLILSIGFAVWLFRCFRGFHFNNLYPLIIGGVLLWAALTFFRHPSAQDGQAE